MCFSCLTSTTLSFCFFRYGSASVRRSLFSPGGSQVQIPADEGAGSVAAGSVRGPAGVPVGRGRPALRELQQGAAASQQDSAAGPHQPSAQLSGPPATGGQPGLPAAPKTQASLTQGQRGELTGENSNKSSSSQTLPAAFSTGARKLTARLSTAAPDDGSWEKS